MNIYKAEISNNNGDTCEWEEYYKTCSPWYSTRELAEKHLPELQKRADFLRHTHMDNGAFYCSEPYIVEKEVLEIPGTIESECSDYFDNLDEFEYLDEGPDFYSVKVTVALSSTFDNKWRFICKHGSEWFEIKIAESDEGNIVCEVEKMAQNTPSNFYRYSKEDREKYLELVKMYVSEDVEKPYREYRKKYRELREVYDKVNEDDNTPQDVVDAAWENIHIFEIDTLLDLFKRLSWLKITEWEFNDIKEDFYNDVENERIKIAIHAKNLVKWLERDRILKEEKNEEE